MSREQYTTGGQSTLASGYTSGSGTLSVVDASTFPAAGVFSLVADPSGTPVWFTVTAVSGATFTVTVEQGTDRNLSSGVAIVEVQTARSFDALRGEAVMVDTLANLPAAAVAGRLFLPTDQPLAYRDAGSAWSTFGPLFPFTDPTTRTWSLVDNTHSVKTTQGAAILLSQPGAGGGSDVYESMVTATPSTPYNADFGVFLNLCLANAFNGYGGLALRESSTGKYYFFLVISGTPAKLVIYRFDNSSNYHSTLSPDPLITITTGFHQWRISDDGTNLAFYMSADGVNWVLLAKWSRTEWMSGGPDEIGICIDTGPNSSDRATSILLASFKVT